MIALSVRVDTFKLSENRICATARWGGVVARGGRLDLGRDFGAWGIYGYGSAHSITGRHVTTNSRYELGGGVYLPPSRSGSSSLTARERERDGAPQRVHDGDAQPMRRRRAHVFHRFRVDVRFRAHVAVA
ncbi:hypothetical protein C7T35_09175 [Variovorax sp. WS11]|uniref:cellulose synthase subunit BcsC-related outer membrane protein n=1 Tax=Variovorax sp. WS11 TaxID=1105204 RepID=UPI000D0E1E6F|nr:hypothetical protein [Variovorax sp. WS11]PSL85046.1 hypothetical protein C7T35_09175 [Variovorax sp. WS11]